VTRGVPASCGTRVLRLGGAYEGGELAGDALPVQSRWGNRSDARACGFTPFLKQLVPVGVGEPCLAHEICLKTMTS
jgi:hypothetical protein